MVDFAEPDTGLYKPALQAIQWPHSALHFRTLAGHESESSPINWSFISNHNSRCFLTVSCEGDCSAGFLERWRALSFASHKTGFFLAGVEFASSNPDSLSVIPTLNSGRSGGLRSRIAGPCFRLPFRGCRRRRRIRERKIDVDHPFIPYFAILCLAPHVDDQFAVVRGEERSLSREMAN